jgi:mannose-6-phosphate isomerase-like protein (cupin superfamily)
MLLINEKDLNWTQVNEKLRAKYVVKDYAITANTISGGVANWPFGEAGSPHIHEDHDEIYIVLRGRGRARILDEIKELGPGDILHARSGEVHGMLEGLDEGGIDLFFMLIPKGME